MIQRERRNAAADVEASTAAAIESLATRQLQALTLSSSSHSMDEERAHHVANVSDGSQQSVEIQNQGRSRGSGVVEAQTAPAVEPPGIASPPLSTRLPSTSALLAAADDESFIFQPVPLGHRVQCRVIRKRLQGALYPEYEVFLEGTRGGRYFLLSAKRRKHSTGATYAISLRPLEDELFEDAIVAKVKSNFLGTLFTIYDAKERRRSTRNELAAVMYAPNVLGLGGPRQLTLLLPGLTRDDFIRPLPYCRGRSQLYEIFKDGEVSKIIVLRNKTPQWNEGNFTRNRHQAFMCVDTQSYVLNFQNRVTHASVKNFQVIPELDIDYIVMQFGRVGLDTFTMDFQYPLSAIQAFGITLTSFDPKLLCE